MLIAALIGATSALAADEGDLAKQVFRSRCQSCHGAEGKGDGMMAKALRPPPASFADSAWQAGIDDDAIKTIILKGGLAVGKSPAMPPHADLARRPGVLKHLVALVRSFGASDGRPMLDVKGRSDLKVLVDGNATKSAEGFSITRGEQTWTFAVNSGVTEPDEGKKADDLLTARAQAWLARTGGKDAKRKLETSVDTVEVNGARKSAAIVWAAVTDVDPRHCRFLIVSGEPSGGFVPWLEASACGAKPPPLVSMVFVLASPPAEQPRH